MISLRLYMPANQSLVEVGRACRKETSKIIVVTRFLTNELKYGISNTYVPFSSLTSSYKLSK